jgi:hypothetical protein
LEGAEAADFDGAVLDAVVFEGRGFDWTPLRFFDRGFTVRVDLTVVFAALDLRLLVVI